MEFNDYFPGVFVGTLIPMNTIGDTTDSTQPASVEIPGCLVSEVSVRDQTTDDAENETIIVADINCPRRFTKLIEANHRFVIPEGAPLAGRFDVIGIPRDSGSEEHGTMFKARRVG